MGLRGPHPVWVLLLLGLLAGGEGGQGTSALDLVHVVDHLGEERPEVDLVGLAHDVPGLHVGLGTLEDLADLRGVHRKVPGEPAPGDRGATLGLGDDGEHPTVPRHDADGITPRTRKPASEHHLPALGELNLRITAVAVHVFQAQLGTLHLVETVLDASIEKGLEREHELPRGREELRPGTPLTLRALLDPLALQPVALEERPAQADERESLERHVALDVLGHLGPEPGAQGEILAVVRLDHLEEGTQHLEHVGRSVELCHGARGRATLVPAQVPDGLVEDPLQAAHLDGVQPGDDHVDRHRTTLHAGGVKGVLGVIVLGSLHQVNLGPGEAGTVPPGEDGGHEAVHRVAVGHDLT